MVSNSVLLCARCVLVCVPVSMCALLCAVHLCYFHFTRNSTRNLAYVNVCGIFVVCYYYVLRCYTTNGRAHITHTHTHTETRTATISYFSLLLLQVLTTYYKCAPNKYFLILFWTFSARISAERLCSSCTLHISRYPSHCPHPSTIAEHTALASPGLARHMAWFFALACRFPFDANASALFLSYL